MGMVVLLISLRVEKEFGIKIPKDWQARVGILKAADDITLAQFAQFIKILCEEQNRELPLDSWARLQRIVADSCGISSMEVLPSSLLIKEIAPNG